MYDKGSAMLNTLRTVLNNDEKWRQLLRGLSSTFYHQTVTGQQVIDYFNRESGRDFTKVFDQYLRHATIPTLEIRFENNQALARWISDVKGFDLPVRMRLKGGEYQFIPVTTKWAPIKELPGATKENLEVDTFNYYIGVLVE
jgi:aminopeptidase N